jgi:hypothetical protein
MILSTHTALFMIALILTGLCCTPRSVIKPFTTDECSGGPEGTADEPYKWCLCCVDHDIFYWKGGTRVERRTADTTFRACVKATGATKFANQAYHVIRIFGSAWFPYPWRWGYGWRFPKGYRPLTTAEQDSIAAVLVRVPIESVTQNSCGH